MKHLIFILLGFVTMVFASCEKADPTPDRFFAMTHWTERPTGQQYLIYGGVGAQNKINLYRQQENYCLFDVTFLAEETVKSSRNSSYFGNQSGKLIIGAGLGGNMPSVATSVATCPTPRIVYQYLGEPGIDIRSSDLGLASTGYLGKFCFQPKIQNMVVNLDFWAGFDRLLPGLYARLRVPITYSRWDLRLSTISESSPPASQTFVSGFINQVFINGVTQPSVEPLTSGTIALNGQETVGDIPLLNYGRIGGAQSITGASDLPFDFGYNWILTERGRFGTSLHIVAPLGTKSDGNYIFAPRVGLGRWQVGVQLGAQFETWNNHDRCLVFYIEAMISALIKSTQPRLLGLKANNTYRFNHYLLLKKYTITGAAITDVALERAANLLFQPITLSTSLNSDIAVWMEYNTRKFEFALGWQFTGRSAEKINNGANNSCNSTLGPASTPCLQQVPNASFGDPASLYVIKGDTPEYLPLLSALNVITGQVISPHGYSKVDSDIRVLGAIIPSTAACPAQTNAANIAQLQVGAFTGADVVADPALHPGVTTNAIIGYIGYHSNNIAHPTFLGIGGGYEAGDGNRAMNMWNIFVKAGVGF